MSEETLKQELLRVSEKAREEGKNFGVTYYIQERGAGAPSHMVFVRRYGSWSKAMETLGVPCHHKQAASIAHLRSMMTRLDGVSKRRYDSERPEGTITGSALARLYGSWNKAVTAASATGE